VADRLNEQVAPYPDILRDLVNRLRYREHLGWNVVLADDYVRDPADTHVGESRGLTLIVQRHGPNTYNHEQVMTVSHLFPVPPASYNEASWRRWLFDRLGDVDTHERMEDFAFAAELTIDGPGGGKREVLDRPFKPNHGPGEDPYRVTELTTDEARRTSFRGDLHPG
jgi:hypothetical protein